jgi:hypothetical protein
MKKLLLLILLTACGGNPHTGTTVKRGALDANAEAQWKQAVADGDAAWAKRGDEAQLRAAIDAYAKAIAVKSDDADTCQKLARAYYFLADGTLSMDPAKHDEYLATHEKGIAVAEQGLRALSPQLEKSMNTGVQLQDAIGVLDRSAVPLLYWYDVNLGKWAKAQDMTQVLKFKDRIFKIMTRVYDLDPDYFYGAPDRYFGGYYAVAPNFAGGDPQKSREYFDTSLKKAPNYLATHELVAELLAPKLQDKALFEREIKFVLDTPANVIPELEPEAQAEKKKAQKLLTQEEDLF